MTSQQEADIALAEHRAVMAALVRDCVGRISEHEYEAQLAALRGIWSDSQGGANAAA